MNLVSTAMVCPPMDASTVLLWPPKRFSDSNTVTECRFDSSHAADRPEIPLPTMAIVRVVDCPGAIGVCACEVIDIDDMVACAIPAPRKGVKNVARIRVGIEIRRKSFIANILSLGLTSLFLKCLRPHWLTHSTTLEPPPGKPTT